MAPFSAMGWHALPLPGAGVVMECVLRGTDLGDVIPEPTPVTCPVSCALVFVLPTVSVNYAGLEEIDMTQPLTSERPFTRLDAVCELPAGHAAFAVESGNGVPLSENSLARGGGPVFVVPVGSSLALELHSLGNTLLQESDGRWRPLRVVGRLAYTITRPELLVELLERDHISEPERFEAELSRIVTELFSRVLDGDSWNAENLTESLDCASGELMRQLEDAVAPLGLNVQAFELGTSPVEA